jgi:hypothetical protein
MGREQVAIELELGSQIIVAGRVFVLTSVYDDMVSPASVTFVTPMELLQTTVVNESDGNTPMPEPAFSAPQNYVYGMLRRATGLSRKDADKLACEIVNQVQSVLENSKGNA